MSSNIINISESPTNHLFGIDLLMNNDKKRSSSPSSANIDFADLDNLEKELNELSGMGSSGGGMGGSNDFISLSAEDITHNFSSGLFGEGGGGGGGGGENISINIEDFGSPAPHSVKFDTSDIGKSTKLQDEEPTWDGYQKFNNIPINPDRPAAPSQPQLTKEEMLREKFKYLRKLEALEKKGVELSKKYSMDSPLTEMQGEYETIIEEKNKLNSIKFQGNMMMACINGIEFLNEKFDPFDIKLDGWSEQINENVGDYDDIFGELYEKYKSKATMAPEIKLMFQLGGSAMMVHMTNTMFKSSLPNMDDILRQNPDLMKSFQQAAVNSMAPKAPGFSDFVGGLMNGRDEAPSRNYGGPPPPIKTKTFVPEPPPPLYETRGGNNSYGQFKQDMRNDNIQFSENAQQPPPIQRSQRPPRQEMKGPSDIDDVLSKLKTKTINIATAPQSPRIARQQQQQEPRPDFMDNNLSTISATDLKELGSGINLPKRGRRKNSRSNTPSMSLDI